MTDYEQIEKYLNNELSGTERAAFEKEMQQDADFKKAVQVYAMINEEMIKTKQESALEETLLKAGEKYFPREESQPKTIYFNSRLVLLYASIAAAVTAIFFLVKTLFGTSPDTQQLFAQYNSFQPVSLAQRAQTNNDTLASIENFYNNKQFGDALQDLRKWNSIHNDIELQMLQAKCLLQLGHAADAIKIFQSISSGQTAFKYDATFYMALSYLRSDNIDECEKILKTIPPEAAVYSRAVALLEQLQ